MKKKKIVDVFMVFTVEELADKPIRISAPTELPGFWLTGKMTEKRMGLFRYLLQILSDQQLPCSLVLTVLRDAYHR